jgi:hypothetical protein
VSTKKMSIAQHIIKLKRSGLSVVEYSKRHAVNCASLYTLMCNQRKIAGQQTHASANNTASRSRYTFTQVNTPVEGISSSGEIELLFPQGIRAILQSGFDATDLHKLVCVLQQQSSAVKGAIC